jgi:hypothetical protein
MQSNAERRQHVRYPRIKPILLENFDTGKYYQGVLFNYSQGGICFESDTLFRPGTPVCIELPENTETKLGPEVYVGYHAEDEQDDSMCEGVRVQIKWCRESTGLDALSQFQIGAKFNYPVYHDRFQKLINRSRAQSERLRKLRRPEHLI